MESMRKLAARLYEVIRIWLPFRNDFDKTLLPVLRLDDDSTIGASLDKRPMDFSAGSKRFSDQPAAVSSVAVTYKIAEPGA